MTRSFSIITKINLVILVVLAVAAGFIFYQVMKQENQHTEEMLIKEAQSIFGQIQAVRHWNAGFGGVYAYKKAGMKPNPYLYQTRPAPDSPRTIEPEITDSNGRKLILINPALMTRGIAEGSKNDQQISYYLTSLNPINPNNAPDDFDKKALRTFEAGKTDVFKAYQNGGEPYFRYIAPLETKAACLTCHGFQGYKVGDVRGSISITIPMKAEQAHAEGNQITLIGYGIALYLLIAITLTLTIRRLVSNPMEKIIIFSNGLEIESEELLEQNGANDELGMLSHSLAAT